MQAIPDEHLHPLIAPWFLGKQTQGPMAFLEGSWRPRDTERGGDDLSSERVLLCDTQHACCGAGECRGGRVPTPRSNRYLNVKTPPVPTAELAQAQNDEHE